MYEAVNPNEVNNDHNVYDAKIIIIIDSTALGGPWPRQANVASDLYSGHSPANLQPSFLYHANLS